MTEFDASGSGSFRNQIGYYVEPVDAPVRIEVLFDAYGDEACDDVVSYRFPTTMTEWDVRYLNKLFSLRARTPEEIDDIESSVSDVHFNEYQKQLILSHIPFAAWFARETMGLNNKNQSSESNPAYSSFVPNRRLSSYTSLPLDFSDRLQASFIGLMKASEKFDPKKGTFRQYSASWMEGSIIRESDRASLLYQTRLSFHSQEKIRRLSNCVYEIEVDGREAKTEELAELTGIRQSKIEELATMRLLLGSLSLDAVTEEHYEKNYDDLEEYDERADEDLVESLSLDTMVVDGSITGALSEFDAATPEQLLEAIQELLSELDVTERDVIKARYGLGGEGAKPQVEVAKMFGLTKYRVSQIEKGLRTSGGFRLLQKLRVF